MVNCNPIQEERQTVMVTTTASLSWSQVGEMAKARYNHGASVVMAEEAEQFCVET